MDLLRILVYLPLLLLLLALPCVVRRGTIASSPLRLSARPSARASVLGVSEGTIVGGSAETLPGAWSAWELGTSPVSVVGVFLLQQTCSEDWVSAPGA